MHRPSIFTLVFLLGCSLVNSGNVVIDGGRFVLNTRPSLDGRSCRFEIVANTTGWVGVGISGTGGMEDSDIIVGGFADGAGYIGDFSAVGHFPPHEDQQNDVQFISAMEDGTHTTLVFERLLDTGDVEEDKVIVNQPQNIIWAVGATDDFMYHATSRGVVVVNLLSE